MLDAAKAGLKKKKKKKKKKDIKWYLINQNDPFFVFQYDFISIIHIKTSNFDIIPLRGSAMGWKSEIEIRGTIRVPCIF